MNYQFFSFLKLAFESFSTLGRSYSCRPVWHQLGLQLKIFLTLSLDPRIIKCCGNCHHRLSDAKKYFIYYGRRIRKPAKNYILGTTDTKSLSIFAKKSKKQKTTQVIDCQECC